MRPISRHDDSLGMRRFIKQAINGRWAWLIDPGEKNVFHLARKRRGASRNGAGLAPAGIRIEHKRRLHQSLPPCRVIVRTHHHDRMPATLPKIPHRPLQQRLPTQPGERCLVAPHAAGETRRQNDGGVFRFTSQSLRPARQGAPQWCCGWHCCPSGRCARSCPRAARDHCRLRSCNRKATWRVSQPRQSPRADAG